MNVITLNLLHMWLSERKCPDTTQAKTKVDTHVYLQEKKDTEKIYL